MNTDGRVVCRVPGVHLGEYSVVSPGATVVCTDTELRYPADADDPVVIPLGDVDRVVTDGSDALSGFRALSRVFLGFALLSSVLSAPFLLRGDLLDPVAVAVFFVAALSWYGSVDFRRIGDTPLDVLEIHAGGRRHVFLARASDEAGLDALVAALAEHAPAVDADRPARGRRTVPDRRS